VNSETLFRATLGSEAYGRYDLLTTVLHELGHLAGLISGTPTYDSRVTNINGTPTATRISARQEATPMLGITNGAKTLPADQLLTQWDTRGSIQVTNANLTLREDDPLLANLSQTFIIPQVAKTLQFTFTDAYLDQSPLNLDCLWGVGFRFAAPNLRMLV
jgi:hypothetical protein